MKICFNGPNGSLFEVSGLWIGPEARRCTRVPILRFFGTFGGLPCGILVLYMHKFLSATFVLFVLWMEWIVAGLPCAPSSHRAQLCRHELS